MVAFGAKRMAILMLIGAVATAFVRYMVLNVPIKVVPIPRSLAFAHLPAVLDAIAIIVIVDVITIVAMVRRRRKGISR